MGFAVQGDGRQNQTAEIVSCLANHRFGSSTCPGRQIEEVLFCTSDVCGPIVEVQGQVELNAQHDWEE